MFLFHDLRYAFRMLRKDTTFTIVAVLSLALGTGANATMFSLVNGMLLRPLAVVRPSEVLTIAPTLPDNAFQGLSYPDFIDFRDRTETMKDLVASTLFRFGFSASPDMLPKVKYGLIVSGNLFQAMGVTPMLGRAFRPEEDQVPGRDAVVILGHDFWQDEFGGDTQVIGRPIRLNGLDFTVIGVAPETFTGMDEFFKATMFVPAMMAGRLSPDPDNNYLVRREWRDFAVRGRLKDGFNASQAETELLGIAKGLGQTYPATNAGRSVSLRTEMQMHVQHMPEETGFMMMAMVMGGLVLLISCFNVANLLLSRTRTREVAIRLATGADRARLLRQLLTESALLGAAGTVAGVWFAWAAARLFNMIKVPSDLPFMIDIRTDQQVLLFSLAAGFLSVMFFGLAPAWQSSKVDLVSALKSTDDAALSIKSRSWVRKVLVVAQIAISVVILLMATMIFHGFRNQLYAATGIRSSQILMMSMDPRIIRYNDEQIKEFYKRLEEKAASAPGVKSISMGGTMSFAINQRAFNIAILREGEQRQKEQIKDIVLDNIVDEKFFDTMAVAIVRGRGFQVTDTADSPRVVIVNEVLAKKYWPDEEAIGKRIQIMLDDGQPMQLLEVVGVARTSKYVWLTEAPTPYLYLPLTQNFRRQRILFVQSHGDAASVSGPIREVIRSLDANMPVFDVRTLEEYFRSWVRASADTVIYIVGSMALTGLLLAMIGLYGLVTYSVARRTREFGIRMAIGATKASVLGMVLRQGTLLCLAGIVVGIALNLPASRFLQALVFGAKSDWLPYVAVPAVLMVVTVIAIFGPARRAATIDPMKALRDE